VASVTAIALPGGPELIVILAVLVLLVGAKKLPELARGVGQSVRELKKGLDDE
jgi:sec-independent protein translocase protein TatA